ncbi:cytochrome c family protein [Novosphingobium sp. MW5]|nr:cytochrome c family protein [Novosphingobium sp. MW5]
MRVMFPALMALGLLAAAAPALSAPPAPNPAVKGKLIFMRCAACHAVSASAPKKVGPHLEGVVGRTAGSVAGFTYSPAMKKAAIKWNDAALDKWLARPAGMVPGTSMVFAGLPNPADRAAVIAYLKKPVP